MCEKCDPNETNIPVVAIIDSLQESEMSYGAEKITSKELRFVRDLLVEVSNGKTFEGFRTRPDDLFDPKNDLNDMIWWGAAPKFNGVNIWLIAYKATYGKYIKLREDRITRAKRQSL